MIEKAMEFAGKVFDGDASGHEFDQTMRLAEERDKFIRSYLQAFYAE